MRTALTVAPVFAGEPDPDPKGLPGEYTCVYVLAYPGAEGYVANVDIATFLESGASLLTFPPRDHWNCVPVDDRRHGL